MRASAGPCGRPSSLVCVRASPCDAMRCASSRRVTRMRCTGMCSHTLRSSWSSRVVVVVVARRRVSTLERAHTKTRAGTRHAPLSCPTDRFIHSLQQGVHACDNRGHLSSGLEGSTMYILGWHHHYHHHRTFDTPSFFRTVPRARVDWRVPRRRRGRWLVRVRWVGVLARARAWGARVDA